ncbi:hypothetical protein BLA29_007995, partial [Euroglyphus maynei]
MSTPLLTMNHQSNWCHSAVSSKTATTTTSLNNTGNVSFRSQTSRFDRHGNFVMPSAFAKSTSTMSLPSTAIFFQKIGCSMSLPILYSDKMTPTNDKLNDNNSTTNEDDDSLVASSLPNLKFFDQNFPEISQRLDSIDLYKDKNEFVESVNKKTITVENERMDQQEQENPPKNSRVDSLDIYKRRRSSAELDLAIVGKCFTNKDQSPDESNETTIQDDLARLKIEMDKSSEKSTSSSDCEISNRHGSRKNSSMIP